MMNTKERLTKINEITDRLLYAIDETLDKTIDSKTVKDLAESYDILKRIGWEELHRNI